MPGRFTRCRGRYDGTHDCWTRCQLAPHNGRSPASILRYIFLLSKYSHPFLSFFRSPPSFLLFPSKWPIRWGHSPRPRSCYTSFRQFSIPSLFPRFLFLFYPGILHPFVPPFVASMKWRGAHHHGPRVGILVVIEDTRPERIQDPRFVERILHGRWLE